MFQQNIIAFATEYNLPKSPIISNEIKMNVKCLGSDIWQLKTAITDWKSLTVSICFKFNLELSLEKYSICVCLGMAKGK